MLTEDSVDNCRGFYSLHGNYFIYFFLYFNQEYVYYSMNCNNDNYKRKYIAFQGLNVIING